MAWKKLVYSGSNAELNQVTASFYKGDGSGITGIISASYALSASWAPGGGSSVTASYALTASYLDSRLNYVHTQSVASSAWSVNHNLNSDYVNITVWSASRVVIPEEIISVNANNLQVTFPSAQAGYAAVTVGSFTQTQVQSASYSPQVRTFGLTIDGGGSAITTGVKGDIIIPYNCYIDSWYITADQVGSIVIDVWKDVSANFPPTVADSIAGSEKPTLSSAIFNSDTNLTTFTTKAISAGDVIRFNVDSVSTVTRVHLTFKTII